MSRQNLNRDSSSSSSRGECRGPCVAEGMYFDLFVPEQGWGTGATRPGDAQLTRGFDVVGITTTISSSDPQRIPRVGKEQVCTRV